MLPISKKKNTIALRLTTMVASLSSFKFETLLFTLSRKAESLVYLRKKLILKDQVTQ